jgi:transaldolase
MCRVLVQVSPQHAYDLEKTLDHARSYAAAFEEVGIDKNNFCIKVRNS